MKVLDSKFFQHLMRRLEDLDVRLEQDNLSASNFIYHKGMKDELEKIIDAYAKYEEKREEDI